MEAHNKDTQARTPMAGHHVATPRRTALLHSLEGDEGVATVGIVVAVEEGAQLQAVAPGCMGHRWVTGLGGRGTVLGCGVGNGGAGEGGLDSRVPSGRSIGNCPGLLTDSKLGGESSTRLCATHTPAH